MFCVEKTFVMLAEFLDISLLACGVACVRPGAAVLLFGVQPATGSAWGPHQPLTRSSANGVGGKFDKFFCVHAR